MKTKFFIILMFLILTTGCYNYNELNTLAIATGMSIDYKEDEYVVNLLISNSKKAQASAIEGEAQSIVYEGKGKSISEALKEIDIISPKKIYIGHLSFIVVSKEISEKGLKDSLDYLIREPESTKRFYLIVSTEDDAKDVLQIVSPLESFPSQSISVAISFSKESQAVTSNIPYSSFIEKLIQKGIEPVLPSMQIKGDTEKGKSEEILQETSTKTFLKLSNLVLFKKDKLVHIANEDESNGINIVNDNIDETLIKLTCKDGSINLKLSNVKTKKNVSLKDKPTVNINIKSDASIQENNCNIDLEKEEEIKYIEKQAEKEVTRLTNESIFLAQKYKTDIFGFGNLFYKHYPKYFDKVNETWNDKEFLDLKININVKINLKEKGSLKSQIKEA